MSTSGLDNRLKTQVQNFISTTEAMSSDLTAVNLVPMSRPCLTTHFNGGFRVS